MFGECLPKYMYYTYFVIRFRILTVKKYEFFKNVVKESHEANTIRYRFPLNHAKREITLRNSLRMRSNSNLDGRGSIEIIRLETLGATI